MSFRKYDHVESLGRDEVADLILGKVYVFPKLDGTNASVWMDWAADINDGVEICAGSRTRKLTLDKDNAGFLQELDTVRMEKLFINRPGWRLYGEWLVPHTFKTYREEAWRKFYVFDVHDGWQYVHFDTYAPELERAGIDIVHPLCIINNPSEGQLLKEVENNTYLIQLGAGAGEGIVLKNYEWRNRFGRQPWAKIVRTEFKEDNSRAFGTTEKEGSFQVEAAIAEEFVTPELVAKERAKIALDYCDERSKIIPRLLQTIYYCIVTEELWAALKKHKTHQTIDFKRLRAYCILQTKKYAADLF